MSNDEEQQMQILEREISLCTDIEDCRSTIEALAAYGHKASPRLVRLRASADDNEIIRALDNQITRIKQGFVI
jgi:hypothetical protein